MKRGNPETATLLVSLVVTLVIAGGLLWWLLPKLGLNLRSLVSNRPASNGPQTRVSAKTFQSVPEVPRGVFNYGGSTTWAPIRGLVDPQLQSAHPGFQLRYVDPVSGTPGSRSGIRMLLDGQLAFAQSSLPVTNAEYATAQQRGFKLEQRSVAIDSIAVVVNPSLAVPGLSLDQLRQIYLGQVTNWGQVGGPNLPITPFSRKLEDGGTVEFFVENVLQKQPLGSNVQSVYSTTEALRRVSNTPGGIYYASAPEAVPQCTVKPLPLGRTPSQLVAPYLDPLVPPQQCPAKRNQLNAKAFQGGNYPITRNLFVVIRQNRGPEQQAGEAYADLLLSDQGQQEMEKAGFLRIR